MQTGHVTHDHHFISNIQHGLPANDCCAGNNPVLVMQNSASATYWKQYVAKSHVVGPTTLAIC